MTTIFPNSTLTTICVNTVERTRILYLPPASTVSPGGIFLVKDICGNAATSSIVLSTTGYFDTFDYKTSYVSTFSNIVSPSYTILSTNGVSAMLMPDGKTNWFILQNNTSNPIYGRLGYSTSLYSYYYYLANFGTSATVATAGPPITSPLGPGNQGWVYPIAAVASSIIDIENFAPPGNRIVGAISRNNWGFAAKGYIYSSTNTTIQFQTLYNDGMVVYYNNSTVVSDWSDKLSNIFYSSITPELPLYPGYNPVKITYFQSSFTNKCLFSWSIPAGAEFISDGTGVMYHNNSSKFWP